MIYSLTKLARRIRKTPQNGRFLEERHTKNLQYCVETHVQVEPLLDDRHQDVCTYGGPDLRLQRVGAGADERFDAQVLLDPLEEQLDVPAAAIQVRDCLCWQYEVVGQKNQPLLPFWVEESDAAQTLGVSLHRVEPLQQDRLIALNAGRFVDLVGDQAPEAEVLSCSCNKKSAGQSPAMEPRKIQVSAVHDIEGPGSSTM